MPSLADKAEASIGLDVDGAVPQEPSSASRNELAQDTTLSWLRVAGCFLLFMNVWGYPSTWGAFQQYYTSDNFLNADTSSVAWIGTTQSTLLIVTGIISGPIFDLGYHRSTMVAGALLFIVGAFAFTSQFSYWRVLLFQGIFVGFGAGLMFVPSLAFVNRAFRQHQAMAISIVFSGTPIGQYYPNQTLLVIWAETAKEP
jgi:MFS family permease